MLMTRGGPAVERFPLLSSDLNILSGTRRHAGVALWLWLWLTVAALLLAGGVGVAGGQPAEDQEKVSIRVQGLPTPRSTGIGATASRRVVERFLNQNPDVAIEAFSMPQIQGATIDTGPLMAIAAGVPPHAIYVNFRQSSTYMEKGFLEPMEVLLARVLAEDPRLRQVDEDDRWLADPSPQQVAEALAQLKSRVPAPAWPVVYRDDESGEDATPHVWALPYSNLVMALLYRKDLFQQAGLDPDRPPQDWDEMLAAARALTVPERQQYGMVVSQELSYGTYSFLVTNGGRAVRDDPDVGWRAAYDSDEAAEAYAFFWEMLRGRFERDGQTIQGAVRIGGPETNLLWSRGQLGMRFSYISDDLVDDSNPNLVGVAPVPTGPNGGRGSEINATMLGVFSGGSPAQRLAAMRYIWFITGDEAQRLRTSLFVSSGYGPFVSPDLLRKFGYDRILERVPAGWKEAFEVSMANGVPEPYGRNTQSIYTYLTRPIAQAMTLDLHDVPHAQRVAAIKRLLTESAREYDVKVLGILSPEQLRQRRIVAGIVMLVVIASFVLGFLHVWRFFTKVSASQRGGTTSASLGESWRKYRWGYFLIAPGLLLTLGWLYLPLLGGAAISVMDYELVRSSTFAGVDNFAAALYDARFWAAFGRTLWFVTLMMILGFWPPILLALLLDEVPTGFLKYFFRTVFYLPAIISGVIIMFLWKQLYDPTPYGVLNRILLSVNELGPVAATGVKWLVALAWVSFIAMLVWLPIKLDEMNKAMKVTLWAVAGLALFGTVWPVIEGAEWAAIPGELGRWVVASLIGRYELEPLRFIDSPDTAMLFCVLPSVWAGAGPGCLLYLAALKTVPSDLYEAASIDGATTWHKVAYITLPRLKFLIVIQFIAAVVAAFKGGADFILAMTGGGPNGATTVLALEILSRTFFELEFGIGSAMAWMLGALLIAFTAYQLKMLSRAEFKGGR